MKSQVLHTVWCNVSGEAAGEIWSWSLKVLRLLCTHLMLQTEVGVTLASTPRDRAGFLIIAMLFSLLISLPVYYLARSVLQHHNIVYITTSSWWKSVRLRIVRPNHMNVIKEKRNWKYGQEFGNLGDRLSHAPPKQNAKKTLRTFHVGYYRKMKGKKTEN